MGDLSFISTTPSAKIRDDTIFFDDSMMIILYIIYTRMILSVKFRWHLEDNFTYYSSSVVQDIAAFNYSVTYVSTRTVGTRHKSSRRIAILFTVVPKYVVTFSFRKIS